MQLHARQVSCRAETHLGDGAGGTLFCGEIAHMRSALERRFAGQAQVVYLDPPFNTGKRFSVRQRVGDEGFRLGKPTITLPAYSDQWESDAQYLQMLKEAAETAYTLLSETGSLFFHIDARMHAHVRIMLDSLFGKAGFVNEIIWTYETGGRSIRHFSRKHDIILYYRKSPDSFFDIHAVSVPRKGARKNHMRRAIDEQGRAYRSIMSLGKEYRYYDDDSALPSDVWDDISHMQQKDPQRTGYDNQKPLALMERIIRCSTRPGDLVCDLFGGSGTTALAARSLGRRFLLLDASPLAMSIARGRLLGAPMEVDIPTDSGTPRLSVHAVPSLGMAAVEIDDYQLEEGLVELPLSGLDALSQISLGYLRDGVFIAFEHAVRSKAHPSLPSRLTVPLVGGELSLMTVDILGRRILFRLVDRQV